MTRSVPLPVVPVRESNFGNFRECSIFRELLFRDAFRTGPAGTHGSGVDYDGVFRIRGSSLEGTFRNALVTAPSTKAQC